MFSKTIAKAINIRSVLEIVLESMISRSTKITHKRDNKMERLPNIGKIPRLNNRAKIATI